VHAHISLKYLISHGAQASGANRVQEIKNPKVGRCKNTGKVSAELHSSNFYGATIAAATAFSALKKEVDKFVVIRN